MRCVYWVLWIGGGEGDDVCSVMRVMYCLWSCSGWCVGDVCRGGVVVLVCTGHSSCNYMLVGYLITEQYCIS